MSFVSSLTIVQYMVASYNLDEMEEKSGVVGRLALFKYVVILYCPRCPVYRWIHHVNLLRADGMSCCCVCFVDDACCLSQNIPMIVLGEAYDFQMNLIAAGTKRDLPTDVRQVLAASGRNILTRGVWLQDLYNRLENCIPCIKSARLAREAEEEHELRIQAGIIIDDFQRLEMMVLIQKITEKVGADTVANLWEEHFDDEIDFDGDILTTDWRKMCLLMRAQNAKSSTSTEKFH